MKYLPLDPEQNLILEGPDNLFVQACPGSGKTRLLTARVIRDLTSSGKDRKLLAAMTFTIKAAEEIQRRIEEHLGFDARLWVGTLHSFCRHWILGPHKGHCPEVKFGLNIADEVTCRGILDKLKRMWEINTFTQIPTRLTLAGHPVACVELDYSKHCAIIQAYHQCLKKRRLIDHDLTLYYSYKLLTAYPQISISLSRLFRHIYVDEVQDLSELQYSILAQFLKHGTTSCFFVGDPNQAIYGSLGGVVKRAHQVRAECGLAELEERSLSNNYRSTQRMADFFSIFNQGSPISCKANYSTDMGRIAFADRWPSHSNLPSVIKSVVRQYLKIGIPSREICILAPQWDHVFGMVRALIPLLPGVPIDAPGICPFKEDDGFWHSFAQLYFGRPTSNNIRWRIGVARKLLRTVFDQLAIPTDHWNPRSCLRLINSIQSTESALEQFLRDVLSKFLSALSHDTITPEVIAKISAYIVTVTSRLSRWTRTLPAPNFLYDIFSHSGLTVSTCHGVKGLEFEVVICFRLHEGWLPHWDHVRNTPDNGDDEARKLLYVISSRAKRYLHLFAEEGHKTRNGSPYRTTRRLKQLDFTFDDHFMAEKNK